MCSLPSQTPQDLLYPREINSGKGSHSVHVLVPQGMAGFGEDRLGRGGSMSLTCQNLWSLEVKQVQFTQAGKHCGGQS